MEIPNESYNEIDSMLSSGTIDVSVDKINKLNIIYFDIIFYNIINCARISPL